MSKFRNKKFGKPFAQAEQSSSGINNILRQARKSGVLNLSNRDLKVIPDSVWELNIAPPSEGNGAFGSEDNWWEGSELTKLFLASNSLREVSGKVRGYRSLTVLDLHDNDLDALPDLSALENLEKLEVCHNRLGEISVDGLGNLSFFSAHHNELKKLPENIGVLQKCDKLDVSHNSLACLPSSIGDVKSLMQLNLAWNQISNLPDSFSFITTLRTVDLRSNKLSALPDFGGFVKLDQLCLQQNLLRKVPNLSSCCSLKELYLANNKLVELQLDLPASLMILEVRDNQIKVVPSAVTKLTNLQRFDVANNDISNLPAEIGNMSCLKVISVEGNPMRSIRRDVINQGSHAILKYLKTRIVGDSEKIGDVLSSGNAELTRKHEISGSGKVNCSGTNEEALKNNLQDASMVDLIEINASKCSLIQIPNEVFNFKKSLTSLNLSSNKLASIPALIGEVTSLKHLYLTNNLLTTLPTEMSALNHLIELNIVGNKFTEVPACVYEISSIEHVIADSNQITTIDATSFRKLTRLSTLSISNNCISQVPPEISLIDSLKTLKLEGNLFRIPRHAIIQKGSAAVLEYLRGRIA